MSKSYSMAPTFRSVGLRSGGRHCLSSERELRLGVCFWFRLFYVAPETTARFIYVNDQSRNQSSPCRWPADLASYFRLCIAGRRMHSARSLIGKSLG